eukprot:gene18791-biopygen14506
MLPLSQSLFPSLMTMRVMCRAPTYRAPLHTSGPHWPAMGRGRGRGRGVPLPQARRRPSPPLPASSTSSSPPAHPSASPPPVRRHFKRQWWRNRIGVAYPAAKGARDGGAPGAEAPRGPVRGPCPSPASGGRRCAGVHGMLGRGTSRWAQDRPVQRGNDLQVHACCLRFPNPTASSSATGTATVTTAASPMTTATGDPDG